MTIKIFGRIALSSCVLLTGLIASAPSHAERQPVLRQIDLPHPYYFREMYLPQLTSGPSSLAWSPDSRELIYSMAGSLWRQKVGSTEGGSSAPNGGAGTAQQLTAGSYDYQPDWSPDGRWVIYSSYRNDAMELWVLDLSRGSAKAAARERRGQRRAAVLARRQAHRLRVDLVQQALSHFHGRLRRGHSRPCRAADRRAQERAAALLLQCLRSRDQSGVDARRQGHHLCVQPQSPLRHRRLLAHPVAGAGGRGPRRGRRGAGNSLRRNQLEGAAGPVSRRFAPGLQLLPRPLLAQPVGDAGRRRRRLCLGLRRLGSNLSALVAGRHADRLHFQPER